MATTPAGMDVADTTVQPDPGPVIQRRHREWRLNVQRWRQLLDAYEGGAAYREAVYGMDTRGLPVRNLIRHKREYPDSREQPYAAYTSNYPGVPPGYDSNYAATDDDYELRKARTPVPTFLTEVVETHLGRIYAQEVERKSSHAGLTAWWDDVDGCGTKVDEWMSETVAPLLLVLGCLDLCFDHPAAPPGAAVETRADEIRLNLDRCVASYVLPENMVWWKLDGSGQRRYAECLVCELQEDGRHRYRHWTAADWTLYDDAGVQLAQQSHPFGVVPIVRVFDRRDARHQHVGKPRYEGIAAKVREAYNRESELILSDTLQAHPLLQAPEDFIQADGTIALGPSWLLPKKKSSGGTGGASYEGFEFIDPPKGAAESIRANLDRLRDAVDREALLTKPAGASGTGKGTVSQSGISKRLDQSTGNDYLAKVSAVLRRVEDTVCEFVLRVLDAGSDPTPTLDALTLIYPKAFDLLNADELTQTVLEYQKILAGCGATPKAEGRLLARLTRLMLPGLDDDDYAEMDREQKDFLERAAERWLEDPLTAIETAENRTTYRIDAAAPPPPMDDSADGGTPPPGHAAPPHGRPVAPAAPAGPAAPHTPPA